MYLVGDCIEYNLLKKRTKDTKQKPYFSEIKVQVS